MEQEPSQLREPERRTQLIERRRKEYPLAHPGCPDFAHDRCGYCGYDMVADLGDQYPTAYITGCEKCHRSWCD